MTTGAVVFMLISWASVIGLLSWAYYRILTSGEDFVHDASGPASPPEQEPFDP